MKKSEVLFIQKKIIEWYEHDGRHDLPWRQTTDLYHIAVSEIMLQQTNVPKVIEKYKNFLKRFPTLSTLAQASQKDVLMQWQGLGYNRRAVYIHQMAQYIVTELGGIFPQDPNVLVTLNGIGPYTSKSILIFARDLDCAACDVNIARIMRRIQGDKDAKQDLVVQWTEDLLYRGRSRDWHNALMDFASLICVKRSPKCIICPIRKKCASYPDPHDAPLLKRREIGRNENGKHVPRRIFRGRIVEYLRNHKAGTVKQIGAAIKNDWDQRGDHEWCENILHDLMKENLVRTKKGRWMLQ